jgi:hypothetical protein
VADLIDKFADQMQADSAESDNRDLIDKFADQMPTAGAAQAAATTPAQTNAKPNGFWQWLQNLENRTGEMGANMITGTIKAGQEVGAGLSRGDVMGLGNAAVQGFVKGGAGLIDLLGNAGYAALQASEPLAYGPNGIKPIQGSFALAPAWEKFVTSSPIGNGMSQYPNLAGAGEFAGQAMAPAMRLARAGAGIPAKLAEAALTGEAYGTLGDIAQKQVAGENQNIFASLNAGLPTGIIGLGMGGALMGAGGIGRKVAPREVQPTPPELVQSQIDELFAPQQPKANVEDVTRQLYDEFPPPDPSSKEARLQAELGQLKSFFEGKTYDDYKASELPPLVQATLESIKDTQIPEIDQYKRKMKAEGVDLVINKTRAQAEDLRAKKRAQVELSKQEATPWEEVVKPAAPPEPAVTEKPQERHWSHYIKERTNLASPRPEELSPEPLIPGNRMSWKPQSPEHKAIVQGDIDTMRKDARNYYVKQRVSERGIEHPDIEERITKELAQSKKDNPTAEYAASELSEKYRRHYLNEFDTAFNKQLDENPAGIREWLAKHDIYKRQHLAKQYAKNAKTSDEMIAKIAKSPDAPLAERLAKTAGFDSWHDFVKEEWGHAPIGGLLSEDKFFDPIAKLVGEHVAPEKIKAAMKHFEGEVSPQSLARMFGIQTNTDIVRQYDKPLHEKRIKTLADLDQVSVDVEDSRTQAGKDAWREAMKMAPEEIVTSDKLTALSDRQREYLVDFKRIADDFVDNTLKPRIKELEAVGHKAGWFGNDRLLRILKDDLQQLRPPATEDGLAMRLLREGRGGYYRSIFLGNQEIAGLHAIEAAAAGFAHDPVAAAEALKLFTRGQINKLAGKYDVAHDFVTAWKTRGMETHLQDSEVGSVPVIGGAVKGIAKFNDSVVKQIEKLPAGATIVDALRAQLPEKAKIQIIRTAMAVRQAKEMNYPGGAEGLMSDLLMQARRKDIPASRQVMLDKVRINMFSDMNRLIMYSPLGFSERTLFQRHGDLVQMFFPFTRSVFQQARLVHSYGEDLINATNKLAKSPTDAAGWGEVAQVIQRSGTLLGILGIFAGAKALPKEADEWLRANGYKQERKMLHQALEGLHSLNPLGQRVEHVQPRLSAYDIAHNQPMFESWIKQFNTAFDEKKKPEQRQKALLAIASLAQIDNVFGLFGTQKIHRFFRKMGEGFKGYSTRYAFSEPEGIGGEQRMLGKRTFNTNALAEFFDWMIPGTPNKVSDFVEQKQEQDWRKRHRK